MENIVKSLQVVSAIDAAIREEENYGELKKYVVSFSRMLSNNLSYKERFAALKAASKKKDSDDFSRFYLSFGVEAIFHQSDCDFNVVVDIYSYDPSILLFAGTIVDFIDGKGTAVDGSKLYTVEKINGRWHIGYENGHPVVYKNYRDYVLSFDDGLRNKIIIKTAPVKTKDAEDYQQKLKKIGIAKRLEKAIESGEAIKFSYTGKSLMSVIDGKETPIVSINNDKMPEWYLKFIVDKKITIDYIILNNNEDSFDSGATYIFATII